MASQTVNGECVDDEAWQCPLSWMGVLPVLTPALCQGQSADFDSCYESRCCATGGFGCFKRVGKVRMHVHCLVMYGTVRDWW